VSASVAQLEIGFVPVAVGESLDMRFARWMRENPKVFADLVEIARELVAHGETRISIDMVFHVARYRHITTKKPGERWTLNNSFTSRAARVIEATYADLAGVFETRPLAAERKARAA
jgi:hypothetical protein